MRRGGFAITASVLALLAVPSMANSPPESPLLLLCSGSLKAMDGQLARTTLTVRIAGTSADVEMFGTFNAVAATDTKMRFRQDMDGGVQRFFEIDRLNGSFIIAEQTDDNVPNVLFFPSSENDGCQQKKQMF